MTNARYVSDRPCPIHGAPVERYRRDNRCIACHSDAQRRSYDKRMDRAKVECLRCGSALTDGVCISCQEKYASEVVVVPCPCCKGTEKDARGRCVECNKTIFDRKVPKHRRMDMRTFLQAVNLQYGALRGDMSWGGIRFDSKNYRPIIDYVLTLRKKP